MLMKVYHTVGGLQARVYNEQRVSHSNMPFTETLGKVT